jgi:hypothetical protein
MFDGGVTMSRIEPVPPEFRAVFLDGGWRKIERVYGARTSLLNKWLVMCGFEEVKAERRVAKRGRA